MSNYIIALNKIIQNKNININIYSLLEEIQSDLKNTYNMTIEEIKEILGKAELNQSVPPLSIDTGFLKKPQLLIAECLKQQRKNDSFHLCINSDCSTGLDFLISEYRNKVDCIYIDPPYNTGSDDFQYKDDFKSNIWKQLMKSNLKKAFNLMKENAVIFISIDDHELINLRLLCDQIFDRFIGMFVWHKKTQPSFLSKGFISVTEYILCYKKGESQIKMKGGFTDPNKQTELLNISNPVTDRYLPKKNTLIYNNGLYTGQLKSGTYGNEKLQVKLLNNITVKNGVPDQNPQLVGRFRWRQEKIDKINKENRVIYIKSIKSLRPTVSGSGKRKIKPPISLLSKKINDIPTNTDANAEMKDLFTVPPFYYPKPTKLIKYLVDSVTYNNPEAIVLDFFAGSGTTGQAVVELNREQHSKMKFILIEQADYFKTILLPRLKKILTCTSWKKGIPQNFDGDGGVIKYFKLENSSRLKSQLKH